MNNEIENNVNGAVNTLLNSGLTFEATNRFFLSFTTAMSFVLACIRTLETKEGPVTQDMINEQIDALAHYMKKSSASIFEDPKFNVTGTTEVH